MLDGTSNEAEYRARGVMGAHWPVQHSEVLRGAQDFGTRLERRARASSSNPVRSTVSQFGRGTDPGTQDRESPLSNIDFGAVAGDTFLVAGQANVFLKPGLRGSGFVFWGKARPPWKVNHAFQKRDVWHPVEQRRRTDGHVSPRGRV